MLLKTLPASTPAATVETVFQHYFGNKDLSGLNLRRIDLQSRKLPGALFDTVLFNSARLVDSDFSGSVFRNADFAMANIDGANFSGCTFENCSFWNDQNKGTNFTGAKFVNTSINVQNNRRGQHQVAWLDTVFTKATFKDSAILNTRFVNVDFRMSRWEKTSFGVGNTAHACNFNGSYMAGMIMEASGGTDFLSCTFTGSSGFVPAQSYFVKVKLNEKVSLIERTGPLSASIFKSLVLESASELAVTRAKVFTSLGIPERTFYDQLDRGFNQATQTSILKFLVTQGDAAKRFNSPDSFFAGMNEAAIMAATGPSIIERSFFRT